VPLSASRDHELKLLAHNLRRTIIQMLYEAQSGHPGGSLSCVEILTVLYLEKMHFDPQRPTDPDRDRMLLSKGHACPALYALFAELGVILWAELRTLRQLGSRLQGHPDMTKLPGIDISSGPLGLGLSAGLGMALTARLDGRSYRTYVLLGDGELQEGIVWEAAMAAAKYAAANLTAIVDLNGVQLDGRTDEVMPLGDVAAKFTSFGWHVIDVDGHDTSALADALDAAAAHQQGPAVILARTVKGKGVSFMEGQSAWHGQPICHEHYAQAWQELETSAP
jgi:transketolase